MEANGIEERVYEKAKARALEKISAALQYPDQLSKTAQIHDFHDNKRVLIEAQLRSLLNSQVNEVREGMDVLQCALKALVEIEKNLNNTVCIGQETYKLIPNYSAIQEVDTILNNVISTRDILKTMIKFPDRIARSEVLFEEEGNILEIHNEIRSLELEKLKLFLETKKDFSGRYDELKNMFSGIEELSRKFDNLIFGTIDNHFQICLERPEIFVKVMQVVYRELKKREFINDSMESRNDNGIFSASVGESTLVKYNDRFFLIPKLDYEMATREHLKKAIEKRFWDRFEDCQVTQEMCDQVGKVDANGDGAEGKGIDNIKENFFLASEFYSLEHIIGGYIAQKSVNRSRQLIVDLERVVDSIVYCFPLDIFAIDEMYFQIYHEGFFELLNKICNFSCEKKNPTSDMLLLVRWVKKFYEPQLIRLSIPPRGTDLIDALKPLFERYKAYLFNVMEEIVNRVTSMDREAEPEILDGAIFTLTPVTLFNIIHMHLDMMISLSLPMMIFETYMEIKKILILYQTTYHRIIVEEEKGYDVMYLVSQINNNFQCYDYANELKSKASNYLDSNQLSELNFSQILTGFSALIKLTREMLINHCFDVLNEDSFKIFYKKWYEEEVAETFIATLNDYFSNEIKGRLLNTYFKKLVVECMYKIVYIYVYQMMRATSSSKAPLFSKRTAERLKYDVNRFTTFFSAWEIREKIITKTFSPLLDLSDMVEVDYESLQSVFETALRNSPDLTAGVVEMVLAHREGIDKKQLKSYMEVWNGVYKNRIVPDIQDEDGIFFKVSQSIDIKSKVFLCLMPMVATDGFRLDVIRAIKQYCIEAVDLVKGMKVLLLDEETTLIISLAIGQLEVLQHEVYLFEQIGEANREEMFHLKAVCFLRATEQNLVNLKNELANPKYGSYYLFFTNGVSDQYLRTLAECDASELVKEVSEFYADYYAINPDFWTLNMSNRIAFLTDSSNVPGQWPWYLKRMTDGITSILLSLKIRPQIRYQSSSFKCVQLAQSLESIIKGNTNFHLGQSKFDSTPLLLILDRNEDPISPLLISWTYQALCHELIGLENNRLDLGKVEGMTEVDDQMMKYMVLSTLQDEFFSRHLHDDYGDLGLAIKKLVTEFQQEKEHQRSKLETIEDIKRVADNLPDYQKISSNVSKHVSIVSILQKLIKDGDLLEVSAVEQELACHENHSKALQMIKTLLDNPKLKKDDAMRIVFLYSLRYGENTSNQLETFNRIINNRYGIKSNLLYIKHLQRFSNKNNRTVKFDLLQNQSFLESFSLNFKRGIIGIPNIYTQHKPLLHKIITSIKENNLDYNSYPALLEKELSPNIILIFIIGGATFEEASLIHSLNSKNKDDMYLLGSTSILNTKSFIDGIVESSFSTQNHL